MLFYTESLHKRVCFFRVNKMECSRTNSFLGIALCSVILIYETLQHIETGNMFNFGVFSQHKGENSITETKTLHDGTRRNISKIIRLLERIKSNVSDPKDLVDIESSILFLKSQLKKETSSTFDFFTTNKLWNTKSSKWKEDFYPNANYSGEICSEVYVRPGDRTPPWPYFKLKESCAREAKKTISDLVTIALNLQTYSKEQLIDMTSTVNRMQELYPDINILVSIPTNFSWTTKGVSVQLFQVSTNVKPGQIWNNLVSKVTTRYVFIAKDILDFEPDSNLERLLRESHPLKMIAIGSATKTSSNGHWSHGCYQIVHKNYTLAYKLGYKHSAHDCLYCHSIDGPFLGRTDVFKKNPFDTNLPEPVLFLDYFFEWFNKNRSVGVCPDSMFNVRDEATALLKKEQWIFLVRKRSLNKVIRHDGQSFEYSCSESNVVGKKQPGLAIAPCIMQQLANHIKFVMRTCREYNIMCELNAGTTIGAVKFNGVLPWERDADVLYLSSNFSAVGKLEPVFKKAGYSLKLKYKPGQGGTHGGAYLSYGSGWKLDFWSKPWMHTAELKAQGKKPTTVMFNGEWVEISKNVGQEIRDRYGPEVYKHVEHSMVLKKEQFSRKTGYTWAGHFTKCPTPGAHNCLDQLAADGNLQFNSNPIP